MSRLEVSIGREDLGLIGNTQKSVTIPEKISFKADIPASMVVRESAPSMNLNPTDRNQKWPAVPGLVLCAIENISPSSSTTVSLLARRDPCGTDEYVKALRAKRPA